MKIEAFGRKGRAHINSYLKRENEELQSAKQVSDKDKEEGSYLGLVSRVKAPMENWSLSNLTF